MENEKRSKGMVDTILNKMFYSMGAMWAKVVSADDIAKSDSWKKKASALKDCTEKTNDNAAEYPQNTKGSDSCIKEHPVEVFESAEGKMSKVNPSACAKAKSPRKTGATKSKAKPRKEVEAPVNSDMEKEIEMLDQATADVL